MIVGAAEHRDVPLVSGVVMLVAFIYVVATSWWTSPTRSSTRGCADERHARHQPTGRAWRRPRTGTLAASRSPTGSAAIRPGVALAGLSSPSSWWR